MAQKTQAIAIEAKDDNDAKEKTARLCVNPATSSAILMTQAHNGFQVDINALMDVVGEEAEKIAKGDTGDHSDYDQECL